MFTEKQLEQLQKLLQINNKEILKAISDSQKDTIEVLMDAIHAGYNMHDKRIKRVENELDLPPLKQ